MYRKLLLHLLRLQAYVDQSYLQYSQAFVNHIFISMSSNFCVQTNVWLSDQRILKPRLNLFLCRNIYKTKTIYLY